MTTDGTLEIVYVPTYTLKQHPRNPRRGDVPSIKASIGVNGFVNPLLVQESTGVVIAGNHRLQAAIELDMESVPVVLLNVDDERALQILLADNRTSDLGGYDDRQLVDLLQEVENTIGLEGTGYSPDAVEDLLSSLGDTTIEGIVADVETSLAPPREMNPVAGTVQARGMREVVLVLPVAAWEAFSEQVQYLRGHYGVQTTSEAVGAAVRDAYGLATELGEAAE